MFGLPAAYMIDFCTDRYQGFGLLAPGLSMSIGLPVCLPRTSEIPSGHSTAELLVRTHASSLMTVPSILDDVIESVEVYTRDVSVLANLDFVAVGGGALKPSTGENLHANNVQLLNHYGATEIGPLAPIFIPDKEYDWTYLRLRRDMGLRLVDVLPAMKGSHSELRCRLVGTPFGLNTDFQLQDELERNPRHPDSEVRILGRNDDLIVLATGEKVLPRMLESHLMRSDLIRTAVAFGDGRFELGVLIEPVGTLNVDDHDQYLEKIWPLVLEANVSMDHHAHITSKDAVIINSGSKVIPRSDKGSIMRREVYATFKDEIDAVYMTLESGQSADLFKSLNIENLYMTLQRMVQYVLRHRFLPSTWGLKDDLFALGMDSLQATRMRRILSASLATAEDERLRACQISRDFIYLHPSVLSLGQALLGSRQDEHHNSGSRLALMRTLADQYSSKTIASPHQRALPSKNVVLMTGSTGTLGVHLLHKLCTDDKNAQIVCLCRPSAGTPITKSMSGQLTAHQREANEAQKILWPEVAWSKVKFLHWDVGAKRLGLDEKTYSSLTQAVTHIIHAAWPMDFKRSLESFEPHIRGVKSLVDLAIDTHNARPCVVPKLVFASSIAAVGRYAPAKNHSLVPEEIINDPSVAVPMGYAEAKWVCEKVLEDAASTHGCEIEPRIIRIGQISGSERTGYWKEHEHIPVLIKASQSVGYLPDLRGVRYPHSPFISTFSFQV